MRIGASNPDRNVKKFCEKQFVLKRYLWQLAQVWAVKALEAAA